MKKIKDKDHLVAKTFLGTYLFVVVTLLILSFMSSCGSGRVFHVGTGQEMYKSECGGYRTK